MHWMTFMVPFPEGGPTKFAQTIRGTYTAMYVRQSTDTYWYAWPADDLDRQQWAWGKTREEALACLVEKLEHQTSYGSYITWKGTRDEQ